MSHYQFLNHRISTVMHSVIDEVSAALSVSSLRNQVIASNIANRDAPGYQRLQVRFESTLANVPTASVVEESAGTPSLEADLVSLSTNAAQYHALTRVLNRYFALVGTITNPNRG